MAVTYGGISAKILWPLISLGAVILIGVPFLMVINIRRKQLTYRRSEVYAWISGFSLVLVSFIALAWFSIYENVFLPKQAQRLFGEEGFLFKESKHIFITGKEYEIYAYSENVKSLEGYIAQQGSGIFKITNIEGGGKHNISLPHEIPAQWGVKKPVWGDKISKIGAIVNEPMALNAKITVPFKITRPALLIGNLYMPAIYPVFTYGGFKNEKGIVKSESLKLIVIPAELSNKLEKYKELKYSPESFVTIFTFLLPVYYGMLLIASEIAKP